ncbi:hypothetical protein BDM02DRAFT_490337 [Thelephora ganbajun]|uniref:Uncharacterized protein n=1 Tax=Thelephora ganbajun TaxID=370292 RepID=A0ACB6Z892_THEGA|nr:hypothetical protein BDM02DRAFT_490337 [Thelephora ganbajun]
MEHVHMRDNYWSPPHTADSTTPFNQADPFLLTPNRREFDPEYTTWQSPSSSTPNFQYTDKSQLSSHQSLHTKLADLSSEPLRSKPLFRGFERPSFTRIAIFIVLCLAAYPALYILTLVARDKSLFVVRLIVAMWCSGVGFALGYVLLKIGVQHLEAATWATVIHMSYEGDGIKLRDLARNSQNPTSFLPALRILLSRFGNRETARYSRRSYDKRPWSLFLGLFIVLATLGPLLPFLFGRIMEIETFARNQRVVYREVLIAGDLSQDDVNRATAQLGAFQDFAQTWTLLPYGRSPPDTVEFVNGNETVYLAQPSLSQFIPGGSGSGTFDANQTASISLRDTPNNTLALLTNKNTPESMSAVLRYPQWGVRIHCEKLPNPKVNLIPFSNQSFTYAFLPQDLLRDLFASYGASLPTELTIPNLKLLDANDTIPSNIDPSKISYLVKWWNNGVAHSFHTRTILDTGSIGDQGWTTVETVLIRLNTSFTPSGRFPVYSNESVPDANGVQTRIGYDAVVCVQKYEPWIIETYNTSVGSPTALRIVEKGYGSTSLLPSGEIRGNPILNTRSLNTTGKNPAFFVAHDNSINQMVKDNGRDRFYVPSPTAVSFTEGAGPEGYIELSPDRFAVIRARVDAANVLPYLAGSGPVVAQSYPDRTLAYVTFKQWQLIGLPMLILILGIIGELFVPTLPLNVPRRGFGVYSWLALLQSQVRVAVRGGQ